MNKRNLSILLAVVLFAIGAIFVAVCSLFFGGKTGGKVIDLKDAARELAREKARQRKPEEKKEEKPAEEKKEEKPAEEKKEEKTA